MFQREPNQPSNQWLCIKIIPTISDNLPLFKTVEESHDGWDCGVFFGDQPEVRNSATFQSGCQQTFMSVASHQARKIARGYKNSPQLIDSGQLKSDPIYARGTKAEQMGHVLQQADHGSIKLC
ncbi:hypothetical protein [Methylobacter sp.]|uniref:hypothetical protein n=1 Tax=Methylobacter sp. TaxID=2051955 RepID=UPI003DA2D35B